MYMYNHFIQLFHALLILCVSRKCTGTRDRCVLLCRTHKNTFGNFICKSLSHGLASFVSELPSVVSVASTDDIVVTASMDVQLSTGSVHNLFGDDIMLLFSGHPRYQSYHDDVKVQEWSTSTILPRIQRTFTKMLAFISQKFLY